MWIDSNFDGGNIEVISCEDPTNIRVKIKKDTNAEFSQWFSFHLYGAKDQDIRILFENAGTTSYPKGWENYQVRHSLDGIVWNCTPTKFDGSQMILEHAPLNDFVHYAYFAPYSQARHISVLRHAQKNGCRIIHLGTTVQGRPMTEVQIGKGPLQVWLIGRQHPGETMAQWWMEGLISRLCRSSDPISREIQNIATLHIVPNMNPDGSYLGNLRSNAAGANLNREWAEPSLDRSPEVFCVRYAMEHDGVDLCIDVHGDEGLPYNFFSFPTGIPSLTKRQSDEFSLLEECFLRASPDFQTKFGYPITPKGQANLGICASFIAEHFGCVGVTLEQPFKENANAPDPIVGWSPQKSVDFGHASLTAIYNYLQIRKEKHLK